MSIKSKVPLTPFVYRARLYRVVDGDTVDLIIDLGFHIMVRQRLRLARINAPEMKTTEGLAAKEFTDKWFRDRPEAANEWPITIRTDRPKYDRYGRFLAEVFMGDENLSDALLVSNHATFFTA